jgi:hypothetical protein
MENPRVTIVVHKDEHDIHAIAFTTFELAQEYSNKLCKEALPDSIDIRIFTVHDTLPELTPLEEEEYYIKQYEEEQFFNSRLDEFNEREFPE